MTAHVRALAHQRVWGMASVPTSEAKSKGNVAHHLFCGYLCQAICVALLLLDLLARCVFAHFVLKPAKRWQSRLSSILMCLCLSSMHTPCDRLQTVRWFHYPLALSYPLELCLAKCKTTKRIFAKTPVCCLLLQWCSKRKKTFCCKAETFWTNPCQAENWRQQGKLSSWQCSDLKHQPSRKRSQEKLTQKTWPKPWPLLRCS